MAAENLNKEATGFVGAGSRFTVNNPIDPKDIVFTAYIPSQDITSRFTLDACRLGDGVMNEAEYAEAEISILSQ